MIFVKSLCSKTLVTLMKSYKIISFVEIYLRIIIFHRFSAACIFFNRTIWEKDKGKDSHESRVKIYMQAKNTSCIFMKNSTHNFSHTILDYLREFERNWQNRSLRFCRLSILFRKRLGRFSSDYKYFRPVQHKDHVGLIAEVFRCSARSRCQSLPDFPEAS